MSETLSPQQAAAVAQGEEPGPKPAEPDSPGETAGETAEFDTEGSDGPFGTIVDAALSTEPSMPLEQVESVWDPERGGEARVTRGIQKATNINGIPAVVDIGIGLVEMWVARAREGSEVNDANDNLPVPSDG